MEAAIQRTTDHLLEQAPEGPWDFVADFAGPLPAIVIAELMRELNLMDLEARFLY